MPLKVGIVGLRGIGNVHAQAHKADSLSDFVAVCDIVKERADAAAQKYGVKAYYNLADMLRNEELDIVDVATGGYENGSWHFEPAMQAMEAGKHILLVAQKSAADDEPSPDDLYDVGSIASILQMLKLPDGTVKSRLFRARAFLKDSLASVLGDLS